MKHTEPARVNLRHIVPLGTGSNGNVTAWHRLRKARVGIEVSVQSMINLNHFLDDVRGALTIASTGYDPVRHYHQHFSFVVVVSCGKVLQSCAN